MAKGEQYEARVEAWITPVLEQHQFELVDVEYVREVGVWYLRCYIDKEGGITVDDCEVISRLLGEWLDKEDFIEDSYILAGMKNWFGKHRQALCPGLGRPLKKEKDFARSIGKDVEIRLYKAIDKQKEFTGTLTSYDADSVTLTMEDGSERTFEKSGIALIRLAFDF